MKCESPFPDRQGFSVFNTKSIVVYSIISFDHFEGFDIAYNCHLRIFLTNKLYRGRMIRLHVVDYEIIYFPVPDNFGYVVE